MLQLSGSCPSTFIVYKKQGNTFDIISPTSNCTISSQGELFSSRKCALRAFEQIFGLTKLVERSVPKRSCNQPWWKICLKKKFYTSDFPRQQKPLRPPQALALSPGKPSNATGDGVVWGWVVPAFRCQTILDHFFHQFAGETSFPQLILSQKIEDCRGMWMQTIKNSHTYDIHVFRYLFLMENCVFNLSFNLIFLI